MVIGTTPFPDQISISGFQSGVTVKAVSLPRLAELPVMEYEIVSFTVTLIRQDGISRTEVGSNSLEVIAALLKEATTCDHLLFTDVKTRNAAGQDYYLENKVCRLSE